MPDQKRVTLPPMAAKIKSQGSIKGKIKTKGSIRGMKRASFFPMGGVGLPTLTRKKSQSNAGQDDDLKMFSNRPSVFDQMKGIFDRDITSLPTAKDLGRLISRVQLVKRLQGQGETVHIPSRMPSTVNLEGSESAEVSGIVNMINILLNYFEEEAVASSLIEKLKNMVEEKSGEQTARLVQEMIMLIGPESRTAAVLKCINQSIVLQGTYEMKNTLTRTVQTKDVRTEDGWQIAITLAEFVQVKHTRKEHCSELAKHEPHNCWDIEWEVRLTFDRDMDDLTAAQLRITNLHLGNDMDSDTAEDIRLLFGNGKLIVG
mmetsp:Transcript_6120/g.7037  ORF Transcript_6120/g.7037 Transcript_6120/m.7037 type:complete len:316 (+) Transcript_6120:392-1339(+)|eukprot:CAMPEP_0184022074 /NCGR_PEP_ID=MMETSP0954-20121128/10358_1 /TAXON_ID=627963 /ORGANISM="Aplanochytrium sp, Strain PBS07" /LENGTH=315 /DNA_ID=CAMNT_0026304317 /DNA_START=370 /DNA_END=1317 /DNA_ORIENTATION=+